jgi:hypothetical protein
MICKNCDYWDLDCQEIKDRPDELHGICLMATFDGYKNKDSSKLPMVIMDGSGYWAGFFTLPNFGCKCFKVRSI